MMGRFVRAALVAAGLALAFATVAHATFPGQNGKIAFSYCGPEDCGLFVMDPDGSGRSQLTHNPYTYSDRYGTYHLGDSSPAWSAQGDRIAFTRQIPYGNENVMVANADGSGVQDLGVSGNDPTWSPDGTKIAFWPFGGIEGSNGIYVMNADGSDVELVHAGFNPRNPDWAPDATTLAYVDRRQDGWQDPEIWVINAAGGTPTSLTPPDFSQGSAYERSSNTDPSWSPDGTRIAFSSSAPMYQKDLFTMRADGSDKVRLTETAEGLSPMWEEGAAWSPDGTRIAYARTLGTEPAGIVVTTADGAEQTFLGPGSGPSAWQPRPNESPDCSRAGARPNSLRPPSKHFRLVTLSRPTDPDGDAVTITIDGVTQDEPAGDAPDARREANGRLLRLRAERDNDGDGRVYRIAFTASDGRTGECSGVATVEVRRHKRRPALDSAPPSYDSFTPSTTP